MTEMDIVRLVQSFELKFADCDWAGFSRILCSDFLRRSSFGPSVENMNQHKHTKCKLLVNNLYECSTSIALQLGHAKTCALL
jgi:hypothetical protein